MISYDICLFSSWPTHSQPIMCTNLPIKPIYPSFRYSLLPCPQLAHFLYGLNIPKYSVSSPVSSEFAGSHTKRYVKTTVTHSDTWNVCVQLTCLKFLFAPIQFQYIGPQVILDEFVHSMGGIFWVWVCNKRYKQEKRPLKLGSWKASGAKLSHRRVCPHQKMNKVFFYQRLPERDRAIDLRDTKNTAVAEHAGRLHLRSVQRSGRIHLLSRQCHLFFFFF